ncbi:MAG: LON peptidase substrate-binding domain-containing protein [Spirochaetia bacterium]
MKQKHIIPIFPLSAVLFPYTLMPLHIFEDRYKELISDISASDGLFGIVYSSGNSFSQVGTLAKYQKTVKSYSDGSTDIITLGKERFHIDHVYEPSPYYTAKVTRVIDTECSNSTEMQDLAEKCIFALDKFVQEIGKAIDLSRLKHLDACELSFVLSATEMLDNHSKQQLLEMLSSRERLDSLLKLIWDRIAQQKAQNLLGAAGFASDQVKYLFN